MGYVGCGVVVSHDCARRVAGLEESWEKHAISIRGREQMIDVYTWAEGEDLKISSLKKIEFGARVGLETQFDLDR